MVSIDILHKNQNRCSMILHHTVGCKFLIIDKKTYRRGELCSPVQWLNSTPNGRSKPLPYDIVGFCRSLNSKIPPPSSTVPLPLGKGGVCWGANSKSMITNPIVGANCVRPICHWLNFSPFGRSKPLPYNVIVFTNGKIPTPHPPLARSPFSSRGRHCWGADSKSMIKNSNRRGELCSPVFTIG